MSHWVTVSLSGASWRAACSCEWLLVVERRDADAVEALGGKITAHLDEVAS